MAGIPGKSGRRPDPDAARRQRSDDTQRVVRWVDLPPEGNLEDPPPLPPFTWYIDNGLDRQWSVRAIELWNSLWHSPQSTMWQRDIHPALDRYLFLCERMWIESATSASALTQMKQTEEEYGLTPKAMLHLYWRVKSNPEVEPRLATVHGMDGVTTRDGRKRMTDY